LNKTRAIFQKVPVIPAMKAVIAEKSGDKVWANVRPPLVELNDAQRAQLIRELDADGFGIPNATELADSTREAADAALAVASWQPWQSSLWLKSRLDCAKRHFRFPPKSGHVRCN